MRQVALRKLGQHCAFPGCTYQTTLAEGVIATEIAHIHAAAPGGPRFDASVARPDDLDNLIILCPNHHRLVDAEPHRFSADVLRRFKDSHAKQLAIESTNLEPLHPVGKSASGPRLSYASALRFWRERTSEPNEEVWHQLFRNNPQIIALAVPGDIVQIGDKCYVGGKSWTNTGGSIRRLRVV